jgi:AraC-like DNA-binding protein
MSRELHPSRLLTRSLALGGERADAKLVADPSAWQDVLALLVAVEELVASRDTDAMLRRSVELARERLGLERVGLYLRDPREARLIFRGTWGTGAERETTDERGLYYECSTDDYEALRHTQQNGALWLYYEHARHFAEAQERSTVIGEGWIVATPLVSGGEVVGVMFNDTAVSHAAVDPGKQARAAVFCGLIANLFVNRRDGIGWHPLPQDGGELTLAERAMRSLELDPVITGERIAEELGISPGHLARSFKAEMGLSLVEYRNRLRIERFLRSVQSGSDNLLKAAREAGFGSYAQFFRVYRKLLGTTPREHLGARRTRAARARHIWHEETGGTGVRLPNRPSRSR